MIASHGTVAKVEGIVGRQLVDNHAHSPEIAGGLRSSPTRSIRSDLDGHRVSPVRHRIRSLERPLPGPRYCQKEAVPMPAEVRSPGNDRDTYKSSRLVERRHHKTASPTPSHCAADADTCLSGFTSLPNS